MSALYMGIDVGQSSTRAIVCDDRGTIVGRGYAGAYNRAYERGGADQLRDVMNQLMRSLWGEEDLTRVWIDTIALGMSAGWKQVESLKDALPPHGQLNATWDGITALRGAIGQQPGTIVIAGTGAVAVSMDAEGKVERCGGWGYWLGDEGSAYTIGMRALQRAVYGVDGRASPTAFADVVLKELKYQDYFQLKAALMGGEVSIDRIASLSKLVSRLAQEGDEDCNHILDWAGHELARLPIALIQRGCAPEHAPIAHVGGVFNDQRITGAYVDDLSRRYPSAQIMPARYPPLIGALMLAYEARGRLVDERVLSSWDAIDFDADVWKKVSIR